MSGRTMTLQQSSRAMAVKSLCTTSECDNQPSTGSNALLSTHENVDQIEADDCRAQCDLPTRLENHEIESCRAVPLINLTL